MKYRDGMLVHINSDNHERGWMFFGATIYIMGDYCSSVDYTVEARKSAHLVTEAGDHDRGLQTPYPHDGVEEGKVRYEAGCRPWCRSGGT